ncbi:MAG: tetratricopeptide repeat protein, partial [Anaerolineae bacterium]|nr:tetratricopeptide repeat protein [Anaerolineae bacterium]
SEGNLITAYRVKAWLEQAPGRGLVVIDDGSNIDSWSELQNAMPPNFKLMVTSTQPIQKSGWQSHTLSELSPADCLLLLSKALDVPSNLQDEMLLPLNEVAVTLKHHPMSLRLAIVWLLRFGGWRAALLYTQRLSETYNVLQNLDLEAPRHHQAEKAFSLIYRTFSKEQRQLFQTCAAFAPGSVIALPALLQVSGIQNSTLLSEGMMPGLMTWDAAHGGYRLNDLLHRYAEALLASQPDTQIIYRNHMDYYEQAAEDTPDFAQYRRVFQYAMKQAPERLMPFVLAVGSLFIQYQQTDELRDWLTRTLTLDIKVSDYSTQASIVRALGDLSARVDHAAAAQAFYERALLLYYQNKSLSGQANTLKALGDLKARMGDRVAAQDFYDRTLLLYAQIDFQLGQANTLKALGDLSVQNAEPRFARDYYNKALALYQQIDFQLGKANTFKALGDLSREEMKLAAATEFYEKALPIYENLGIHLETAEIYVALAVLKPDEAVGHYQQALARYQKINNGVQGVQVLLALARWHRQQEESLAAEKYLAQALALCHHHHLWMETAQVKYHLGEAQLYKGDTPGAILLLLQALEAFEEHHMMASVEQARTLLRTLSQQHRSTFDETWQQVTNSRPKPDWLLITQTMPVFIPPELIYAVRDFMLIEDPKAAQRHVETHSDLLLTDAADEVFARMLRQYAGQSNPTRQIDRYRAVLQRCRQVGIYKAFEEISQTEVELPEEVDMATRLTQTLDAYDEALERLRDMPLVYASIQLNRAQTLRELSQIQGQDTMGHLKKALEAYNAALECQQHTPLDYAQTQIQRAGVLRQLAELPDAPKADYLRQILNAYDDALNAQKSVPLEYARTQMQRASTLHELAGFGDAQTHMKEGLTAYNEAIAYLKAVPVEYAKAQSHRAHLLYEMAGLPGENFRGRMWEALTAYDEALEYLRDDPVEYAKTQSKRVALLRDMAGLPGEDRTARLYQALAASNEALRYLSAAPSDYARTQVNRGFLLREIAGLEGEHRLARMREAIASYNNALEFLPNTSLEFATTQTSRASLLRELALLSGENQHERLRQALDAAAQAIPVLEKLNHETQLRTTQRILISIKEEIIKRLDETAFSHLWQEIVARPQPEWLT